MSEDFSDQLQILGVRFFHLLYLHRESSYVYDFDGIEIITMSSLNLLYPIFTNWKCSLFYVKGHTFLSAKKSIFLVQVVVVVVVVVVIHEKGPQRYDTSREHYEWVKEDVDLLESLL